MNLTLEVKEARRTYCNNYYKQNREQLLSYARQRRLDYPENNRLAVRRYKQRHKPELLIKERLRRQQLAQDPQYIQKRREYARNQNRKYRMMVLNAYGMQCVCCGETNWKFLSIDHVNGGGYKHRKAVGGTPGLYKWIIHNNYPPDFQILCFNCNQAKGFYGACPHKET